MDRHGRPRIGLVLVAAAAALAAVGGSAVGFGAPVWLAGAVAAVSALIAGTVVDRVFMHVTNVLPRGTGDARCWMP